MIYITKEILVENQEALDQLVNLNINSHKIFRVKCDLQISRKCKNFYNIEYRQFIKNINNNNKKLLCLFCSRKLKFSGRKNPNTKYCKLNDSFFDVVDSIEKAYLLGWIASDGHIGSRGFVISIHENDINTLTILRNIICKDIPITYTQTNVSNMCRFTVNSNQISNALCVLLKIKPGKKSDTVNFPELQNIFIPYFLRGYFEGDGTINNRLTSKGSYPRCSFSSNSIKMLNGIKNYAPIKSNVYRNNLFFNARETLYFLNWIYSDTSNGLFLKRKYDLYKDWKNNYKFNSRKNINHEKKHKNVSEETRKKMSAAHSGEKSYSSKLNWEQVKKIRMSYSTGNYSFAQLGKTFNVAGTTIKSIIKNKTWKDIFYIVYNKDYTQKKRKKLAKEQVIQIKHMLKNKTARSIAKKFKVSKNTILAIKHNRIWKEIVLDNNDRTEGVI